MEQRVRGSTTFERLVQAGLVGYGSLHLLTAWISVSILIGQQPATTSRGALADLAQTGTGLVLLLVLAVGFVVLAV